eukprot:COSAG01_NODE_1250_length_11058_cov_35.299845_1_plen_277_part_00
MLLWLLTASTGVVSSIGAAAGDASPRGGYQHIQQPYYGPGQQRACNYSEPVSTLCRSFCTNQCSFFNISNDEQGQPQSLTVYRLTPANNVDLVNKDVGDAAGDLGFFLSGMGGRSSFLVGTGTVIVQYEVQVDGRYGPYMMCNPLHGWKNQTNSVVGWYCSQSCNSPPNCHGRHVVNSTINGTHGASCDCGRAMHTVGRDDRGYLYEHLPHQHSHNIAPPSWGGRFTQNGWVLVFIPGCWRVSREATPRGPWRRLHVEGAASDAHHQCDLHGSKNR